jgi:hypothetical protein
MESLRPDAQAEPWGLRVMDFSIGRYRDELAWIDALAVTATGGTAATAARAGGIATDTTATRGQP